MGLRASPAPTQVELRAPTDHSAPFCRSEGLLFLPKARQWATWTGSGNEEHGVLGSIPVIHVFTIRLIPS
jgi:hypothetical protein